MKKKSALKYFIVLVIVIVLTYTVSLHACGNHREEKIIRTTLASSVVLENEGHAANLVKIVGSSKIEAKVEKPPDRPDDNQGSKVPAEFAPQYDGKVASCQLRGDHQKRVKQTFTDKRMTIPMCERKCYEAEAEFAGLSLGTVCECLEEYGSEPMDKYSECNTPCGGDSRSYCGSETHEFVFRIVPLVRRAVSALETNSMLKTEVQTLAHVCVDMDTMSRSDDNRSLWNCTVRDIIKFRTEIQNFVWYSPWTKFHTSFGQNGRAVTRRFSGCDEIDFRTKTECDAKIQTHPEVTQESLEGPGSHFISCFTDLSFTEDALFKISFQPDPDLIEASSAARCIAKCEPESDYAIVLKKGCFCSNSLGWAQPADGCEHLLGAAVFATEKFTDTVHLKFEKEVDKTKVLVVAHYRGGSTVTLEMFNSYPGALSLYEPDMLLGSSWPGVTSTWQEEERARVFLQQILPAWLDCRQDMLPGYFSRIYPVLAEKQSGMRDIYTFCKRAVLDTKQNICLKFLKEYCLKAPLVVAKSVRILAPLAVDHAVMSRPDVSFLYVVRDPRAQLSSRMKMLKWWSDDPIARLDDLCTEMVKMEPIFHRSQHNNSQIIFYETQALNLVKAARKIYRAMGLDLHEVVKQRLEYISGKVGHDQEDEDWDEFSVVRSDSAAHINDWAKQPKDSPLLNVITTADRKTSCSQLYKLYSDIYIPFTRMKV